MNKLQNSKFIRFIKKDYKTNRLFLFLLSFVISICCLLGSKDAFLSLSFLDKILIFYFSVFLFEAADNLTDLIDILRYGEHVMKKSEE